MNNRLKENGFNTDNVAFVIAEIGINHGGDIGLAKRLIDSAAKTGCDAVKFQTYITEKRVSKKYNELFNILKKCELPFNNFNDLKKHANDAGLIFFSTPFDKESLEYLESIGTDIYKIASFDVVNKPLLKKISKTGKPIIMSVGMANISEISEAYNVLISGSRKLAILHCVSAYPIEEKDANLYAIKALESKFKNCLIGYSDHTNGIKVPLYAVMIGAKIIEKHYRISDEMECVDSSVSINEKQMKMFIHNLKNYKDICGDGNIGISEIEKSTMLFRRHHN